MGIYCLLLLEALATLALGALLIASSLPSVSGSEPPPSAGASGGPRGQAVARQPACPVTSAHEVVLVVAGAQIHVLDAVLARAALRPLLLLGHL